MVLPICHGNFKARIGWNCSDRAWRTLANTLSLGQQQLTPAKQENTFGE